MNPQPASRVLLRVCLRKPSVTRTCRQQLRHLSSRPSPALAPLARTQTHFLNNLQTQQRRCESTAKPLTDRPEQLPEAEAREEVPSYEMTFTCKACSTRSSHRMSKQGYHHGTILITCPGCKNRHLIADHLKIFSDKAITMEDILAEKGQLLKKGALDSESDMEFWDDGTQTEHTKKP
ncbi:zf-DNL-domain-containing protein [Aureobasidium subglaciale]|nr:zf-DNL-domain-containing protein [Aureobasidium subglaciale]